MEHLIKIGERLEDLDLNGLKIIQNPDFFCFGIDAVLLAWFASSAITRKTKTIDLGTGTGILPLLLYGRTGTKQIDALEIQENVVDLARRNVELNGLSDIIHIHHGDLRNPGPAFHSSNTDVVVCNPPYMRMDRGMKNPSETMAISRHELCCTISDVTHFARVMLKDRGKLFLVQRADRLGDVLCALRADGLEAKRLVTVHPYAHRPANLILVEAMKKGKPNLKVEPPLVVYNADGSYSDAINAIYGTDGPTPR